MNRIISKNIDFSSTGAGQSWTCPAGITSIWVTFGDRSNTTIMSINATPLEVVPNTVYTFTINQLTYGTYGNPNTFGSLLSWVGADCIYIQWVE